jgi:peroxiredoxin
MQVLNNIYEDNVNSPDLDKVMDDLDRRATDILDEMNGYTRNFIDENLTSLVSLVALYKQIAPGVYILNLEKDLSYYQKVDSTLFSLYPESEPVISLHNQLAQVLNSMNMQAAANQMTGIGALAPEISLPNPEGDTIKLSSTRGKYILLDFWAAWCAPCRGENPNIVEAYNKYRDKGFDIYQVSLDQTREAWLNGIKEDKLEQWTHVSDLGYWNSVVVPLYGIQSIPASFLLDKEGRIIATNLRGEALGAKLSELLD